MKILLQGYIGHKNFGDDLLFKIAVDRVKKNQNSEIFVVITNPNIDASYLRSYYEDLKIIRFNKKIPLFFFRKFDKILFIGGGVFFDYKTNFNTLSYFKSLISNYLRHKVTRLYKVRYAGIGIGIGPYFSNRAQKLHSLVLKNFDILGVRDAKSFENAISLGVDKRKLYLSNDLSIGLFDKVNHSSAEGSNDEIIFCPRSYAHKPAYEKHINVLIEFSLYLEREKQIKTHWVFLQREKEETLISLLEEKGFKVTIWNPLKVSLMDFFTIFQKAKATVSSRMHSLFVSGLVNKPFIAIELHQKLRFASELFYEKPLILNPKDEVRDYITAYNNLDKLKKRDQLNTEIKKILVLDDLLDKWLNDK